LDWRLSNQTGDAFLKQLKADARLAGIPVVVFTTSDNSSDLATAYACGANGYVVKPGTFDELVHCVGDLCRYWLGRNLAPHLVGTPC
jgi:two-component system response regulator